MLQVGCQLRPLGDGLVRLVQQLPRSLTQLIQVERPADQPRRMLQQCRTHGRIRHLEVVRHAAEQARARHLVDTQRLDDRRVDAGRPLVLRERNTRLVQGDAQLGSGSPAGQDGAARVRHVRRHAGQQDSRSHPPLHARFRQFRSERSPAQLRLRGNVEDQVVRRLVRLRVVGVPELSVRPLQHPILGPGEPGDGP